MVKRQRFYHSLQLGRRHRKSGSWRPSRKVHYENDIPVLLVNSIRGETVEGWQEGFNQGAKVLGNAPVGILDLRFNPVDMAMWLSGWLKEYAKAVVPSNSMFFFFNSGRPDDQREGPMGIQRQTLVILTSKWTASAAEMLIDAAYNLENVLIVGENTDGAMIGSSAPVQLPNSKLSITIGPSQAIIPDTTTILRNTGLLPRSLGAGG